MKKNIISMKKNIISMKKKIISMKKNIISMKKNIISMKKKINIKKYFSTIFLNFFSGILIETLMILKIISNNYIISFQSIIILLVQPHPVRQIFVIFQGKL